MPHRLGELAERVEGEVRGDPDLPVRGIRALEDAGPQELSLLTHPRYRSRALESRAAALLVGRGPGGPRGVEGIDKPLLVVADPAYALARLLPLFHPEERPPAGVHPSAVVDPRAEVAPSAHVGPYAVVGAGSRLEEGAVVEAHAVVGRRCRVGEGSWLHPQVVLYDGTEIGRRVIVHSGTVLGSDGFGYATHRGVHHKVPQVGRVVVEDDVEIGANTTVDRGSLGETRIGRGAKLDNLVQVAHNVSIGENAVVVAQVGIAGSATIGPGALLLGQAGIADHVRIGARAFVGPKSGVRGDLGEGERAMGYPHRELGAFRRIWAAQARLPSLLRRVRALERRLGLGPREGGEER